MFLIGVNCFSLYLQAFIFILRYIIDVGFCQTFELGFESKKN